MEFRDITLGDGSTHLIDVSTPPRLIRRGVLSMTVTEKGEKKQKPIYIVELAEETNGVDLVSVYDIDPKSEKPQKKIEYKDTKLSYSDKTFLGSLANKMLQGSKDKPYKREVVTSPPLFIAPVTYGIGTFTGKPEKGFYERERDIFSIKNKEPHITYGKNTGIFIGLDSIKWEKSFVNAGDLVQNYVADKLLWFNFGVAKPQFKSEAEKQLTDNDESN